MSHVFTPQTRRRLGGERERYDISDKVYVTGRQKEEDGKTLVCDKRDRAITCVFCRNLQFTLMFSGPLPKDLFKGK